MGVLKPGTFALRPAPASGGGGSRGAAKRVLQEVGEVDSAGDESLAGVDLRETARYMERINSPPEAGLFPLEGNAADAGVRAGAKRMKITIQARENIKSLPCCAVLVLRSRRLPARGGVFRWCCVVPPAPIPLRPARPAPAAAAHSLPHSPLPRHPLLCASRPSGISTAPHLLFPFASLSPIPQGDTCSDHAHPFSVAVLNNACTPSGVRELTVGGCKVYYNMARGYSPPLRHHLPVYPPTHLPTHLPTCLPTLPDVT